MHSRLAACVILMLVATGCADPDRLSAAEAERCKIEARSTIEQKIRSAEAEYPLLLKRLASERDAKKWTEQEYGYLRAEIEKVPEWIEDNQTVYINMLARLTRATETEEPDIRESVRSGMCNGGIYFGSPTSRLSLYLDNPEQGRKLIEPKVREEENRKQEEKIGAEMDRINEIKSQLTQKSVGVSATTDGYGAVVQLFHMPDGNSLKCTTDFGDGTPLFWCDGGYNRYMKKLAR